jgi:SAM-dependent methyltransferase
VAHPLGGHDPFRDPETITETEAREWAAVLDQRGVAPDQVALRRRLVELVRLKSGATAVDLGCGTGVLLADLARAVGPKGRAVGVEPQPVFVDWARQRMAREGLTWAEVRAGRAERSGLPDASADACLALTVLNHVPAALLTQALAEMMRVVRPGGRVLSADQDADTWTIDHPDRELTRRLVIYDSDQRFADGWTGRRLRGLFLDAGLTDVEVQVLPTVDDTEGSYLQGRAERLALRAAEMGVIGPDQAERWIDELREVAARGRFFSSINYYACVGVRPARGPG